MQSGIRIVSSVWSIRGRRVLPVGVVAVFAFLTGCEAFFTTSAFANLSRDPENMSVEQLLAYSEEAIASGNAEKMEEAFRALHGKTEGSKLSDRERDTLVDLGLGASDVAGYLSGNPERDTLDAVDLSDYPGDIARETARLMSEAPDGDFSPDRYAYAGAGVVLAMAKDDGFESIDLGDGSDDSELAKGLLASARAGYEADEREDDEVYQYLNDFEDSYTS